MRSDIKYREAAVIPSVIIGWSVQDCLIAYRVCVTNSEFTTAEKPWHTSSACATHMTDLLSRGLRGAEMYPRMRALYTTTYGETQNCEVSKF